jgi:hypothetical protein
MEILKFDESGPSSPSRKPFGRSAILVTFVALVFGAGTALASGTLTVNDGEDIELAQGVTQTTQCDTSVNISLDSQLSIDPGNPSKFYLHGISVSGISDDCLPKTLRLKVYSASGTQQIFCAPAPVDIGCSAGGDYIEGAPAPGTSGDNRLNFILTNVLEIASANTAKNITIETIG